MLFCVQEWIRIPAIFYSGMMFAMCSSFWRRDRRSACQPALAGGAGAQPAWLLMPILLTIRLWREHPFTSLAGESENLSVAPGVS